MSAVTNLPSRGATAYQWLRVDGLLPPTVEPIVDAYADGTLMTREEFVSRFDVGAAAEQFRLKSYEPKIPEVSWADLAPGARNIWLMHAQCVLDAAIGEDTR